MIVPFVRHLCVVVTVAGCLEGLARADEHSVPVIVKPFRHTVRTGDTPSKLAARWGVPESMIVAPGKTLKIGDVITIPLLARETVHRGSSLSAISQKYHVAIEVLARFNRLPPPYHIKRGSVVLVPAVK